MIDSYGRKIDYLRVSVTDRCNLRCLYCMPEDGITPVEKENILNDEEIVSICRILSELGVTKVKLTGGEPLIRKGIPQLVEKLKNISGIEKVTLTTNGVALKDQMDELVRAGLDGLNISLDTRNPQLFQQVTRRPLYREALEGIQAALQYPQIPLKINCVPLGMKEQRLDEIAAFARDARIHVRFIEMMPIGLGKEFAGQREEEIIEDLEKRFGKFIPYEGEKLGNGPCHYYTVEGFQGKIGFISAISHKFCHKCNRIRLTSQGYLKTCLQYTAGRDLRELLRNGASPEEIKKVILEAIEEKPVAHAFLEKAVSDETESLCMSQIGG